jgi:hypothetical protein
VGGAIGVATLSGIDFTIAFAGQAALVGVALVLPLAPQPRARTAR